MTYHQPANDRASAAARSVTGVKRVPRRKTELIAVGWTRWLAGARLETMIAEPTATTGADKPLPASLMFSQPTAECNECNQPRGAKHGAQNRFFPTRRFRRGMSEALRRFFRISATNDAPR